MPRTHSLYQSEHLLWPLTLTYPRSFLSYIAKVGILASVESDQLAYQRLARVLILDFRCLTAGLGSNPPRTSQVCLIAGDRRISPGVNLSDLLSCKRVKLSVMSVTPKPEKGTGLYGCTWYLFV